MTPAGSPDAGGSPGDEATRLREHLAALDGLHADGFLTDEEYRAARDMAIAGVAEGPAPLVPLTPERAPSPGPARAPRPGGEPPGAGGRRPGWLLPVAGGALVAAAALIVVIMLVTGAPDESSPPPAASGDSGVTRTVRVTRTLDALYVGSSSGRCFGPRPGASFTVGGVRRTTDFLNCGDDDPSRASGTYEFRDLPDGVITSFRATFAIDEGSAGSQRGSFARVTARYGDRTLCRATVEWGSPYACDRPGLDIPTSSGTLVVSQEVTPATSSTSAGLWVGIVGGRVAVSVERAA